MMVPPHLAADAAAPNSAPTSWTPSQYEAHRIALGIPRGGVDFGYGDAFPHEADMDQLGGIDFAKGCYVGQEVVSRMEHRGIARTRAVPVAIDGDRAGSRRGRHGRRPAGRHHGLGGRRPRARAAASRPRGGSARRRRCRCSPAAFADPAGQARMGAVCLSRRVQGRANDAPATAPPVHADGSPAAPGRRTMRSTSPITTRNGACRNTTTARSTKSSCSTAFRPACRGSRSCASARISAAPSTVSRRKKSRATRRRKSSG